MVYFKCTAFNALLLLATSVLAKETASRGLLSGSADPGRKCCSTQAKDPVDILNLDPSESLALVDSATLSSRVKLFKYQRSIAGFPLFDSAFVIAQNNEDIPQYSILTDASLKTTSAAQLVKALLDGEPPMPTNSSIITCCINADIDLREIARYINVNVDRYIHLVDTTDGAYAIFLDDVRLVNLSNAAKGYRCLIDVTNQTVWGVEDLLTNTPPQRTLFNGLLSGRKDLPINSDYNFCRIASKDYAIQIFDQKFSTRVKPIEQTPMEFGCELFDYYKAAIQCLDYANITGNCLREIVNVSLRDLYNDDSLNIFIHHGTSQFDPSFFTSNGIYFAGGLSATDQLCGSLDTVAFLIGYAATSKMSQLIYADDSKCLADAFSGLTAMTVSQHLVTLANKMATNRRQNRLAGAKSFSYKQQDVYLTDDFEPSCNIDIPLKLQEELAKRRFDLFQVYKLLFGANRFFWSKYTSFSKASCGILQYARQTGLSGDAIAKLNAGLAAANLVGAGSDCDAVGNLRQPIKALTPPGFNGASSLPKIRQSPDILLYKLENCGKLYGLSGKQHQVSYYMLTIPTNLPKKPTKLVVTLRISASDENSLADIYLKYGSVPKSRSDFDLGRHFEDGEATITVSNPPDGDYYVILHGYDSYDDVTLGACYFSEASALQAAIQQPIRVSSTTTARSSISAPQSARLFPPQPDLSVFQRGGFFPFRFPFQF